MRKAVQIFLIIGMVSGAIIVLSGLITLFGNPNNNQSIIDLVESGMDISEAQAIVGITDILTGAIPLVLAIFAYKHFMSAQKKSDVGIGWSIVTILFVNTIAGILMLCIKDEHFPGYVAPVKRSFDYLDRLTKLKELLDMGAITQEEFDSMKQKLFDENNF